MINYCKKYIEKYYEHYRFFRPECMDKRIREVMMRRRLCHACPGLDRCEMHPEFWLQGEEKRLHENQRLLKEYPDQGDMEMLPDDVMENMGTIQIIKEIVETEKRLGV